MTDDSSTKDADDKLFEARFILNMKRVSGLIDLVVPRSIAAEGDPLESDISRAVVVLLHATFEDMLRTVARQRAGTMNAEALADVPLSGASRRAEKFHLGALERHRGKTVDDLLRESVEAYWEQRAFGSCNEVENALRQMGLDTEPFKFLYPGLDSMMKRRHQIVHDADLPNATAREAKPWGFSDNLLLMYWLLHVLTFNAQLHVSIDPADELHRWYLARRTTAIERAREVIRDLLALAKGPADAFAAGFQALGPRLMEVQELLGPPSEEEIREIARKLGIES